MRPLSRQECSVGTLFADDFLDEFGTWPLAYIPTGGADFGEIAAVAKAVNGASGDSGAASDSGGDSDTAKSSVGVDAFYREWMSAAARVAQQADDAMANGHHASARALHLRASAFYASAYHPLYGDPVDQRLLTAFRAQVAQFDAGMAMWDAPVRPMRIPFENTTLPAYLIPAIGHETETRPLIIFTNGYDATITDMYFASAAYAVRRGYHALVFDGPGQGELLYEQRVHLRPDWETVVGAVIDVAVEQPIVDAQRIVLSGWSLGGHLAPRAASVEHRIAALVADPALADVGAASTAMMIKMGVPPDQAASIEDIDQGILDQMMQFIEASPAMRWSIVQRGFWVNGVSDLRAFLRKSAEFTLADRIGDIRSATLVTRAQNDQLAAGVQAFYDALTVQKTLLEFTAAEGAGDHCEMFNRSLLNGRVLDWLDDTLA
jgi:hypothetical protein